MRNVLTWFGLYTLVEERTQVVCGIADEVLNRRASSAGLGQ